MQDNQSPDEGMSRIDAIDKINHARHLFEAALMALADIGDDRQRKALDTLLYDGLKDLVDGLAVISPVEGSAS